MKVKKIVIKSTSGYCSVDYAYSDKLTITSNSVAYEYKPYLNNDNVLNAPSKWSYKTTNVAFALVFEKIVGAIDEILKRDQEFMYYDSGNIDFIVTYEDERKASRNFFAPADEFEECFKIIGEIIPVTEDIPMAIRLSE